MNRKSIVTRVVSAMLLALSGCHDLPTAVPTADPAARSEAGGLHLGQSPVVCSLGRAAPAPAKGWLMRQDTIFVPRSEFDAGGQMVRYTLIQMADSEAVAYVASCTVPYTEAALRRLDRYFGVQNGGGADQFVARQGVIKTQGCVSDGQCELEGLVVTAPPPPIQPHRTDGLCAADPAACGEIGGEDRGGSVDGTAYQEGPILWGACVLAMVGSSYSIWQVSDKFQTWYTSYQAAEGAYRIWQTTVQNNADPLIQQLYEYQYKQARLRQQDAAGAVSEATNTSYLALGGAAIACGATALLPTP